MKPSINNRATGRTVAALTVVPGGMQAECNACPDLTVSYVKAYPPVIKDK